MHAGTSVMGIELSAKSPHADWQRVGAEVTRPLAPHGAGFASRGDSDVQRERTERTADGHGPGNAKGAKVSSDNFTIN